MTQDNDVIFAPITARGGAIFVVRISGKDCLRRFFDGVKTNRKFTVIKEKTAHLVKIFYLTGVNPNPQILDEVLILYFENNKSFTGEDTIEISLHGSNFIIDTFLEILNKIDGFRFARNGEFTKRAFLNGKIDLLKAESINSIIKSENRNQHFLSSQFFSGNISNIYQDLRNKIINLISKIEVYIDFPEEDIPSDILNDIELLKKEIENHLKQCQESNNINRLQNAIKIGFFGNPNCGKSSLLNNLSKRDLAIVSNIKGTTRDILTNEINIKGEKIILCDTAGIRNTKNKIEKEGIKRTLNILNEVDIKIFLFDCKTFIKDFKEQKFLQILEILQENIKQQDKSMQKEYIILMTKFDLIEKNQKKYDEILSFWKDFNNRNNINLNIMFFSVLNRQNLINLENEIFKIIQRIKPEISSSLILNERHFLITKKIESEIKKINLRRNRDLDQNIELIAEDLRDILFLIQEITGEIRTDDILDKIFREFCIGK